MITEHKIFLGENRMISITNQVIFAYSSLYRGFTFELGSAKDMHEKSQSSEV